VKGQKSTKNPKSSLQRGKNPDGSVEKEHGKTKTLTTPGGRSASLLLGGTKGRII